MAADDVAGMLAVQASAYGTDFLEDGATLLQRWQAAPATAWVAEDDAGLCGYLVAYPSKLGKVTALHGSFELPAAPDCLYLHDLAISPRAAGQGLAPALLLQAWAAAARLGLGWAALVSVQDSHGFWTRRGFAGHPGLATDQAARLTAYPGGTAVYMVRRLTGLA